MELLKKLADPNSLEMLNLDSNKNQLVSKTGIYNIQNSVPLLLPSKAEKLILDSHKHEKFNSSFQYIDHYQKDAQHFDYFEAFEDGATIHENRRLHEAIINEVPKDSETILDVGCGNAWVAWYFCEKGKSVCSFDISLENTSKALQKYPYPKHTAVVGDVYHLPFQDNSFDCIVSAEVIEHVPDPKSYLESLLRVVKKGGTIVISTPYNELIPHYLCIHCNRPTPQHAHLHSFDEKKILSFVPEDINLTKVAYSFSNKYLAKLRTHIFLKYLPFKSWWLIDSLVNKFVKKQQRLILKIVKE